MPNSQQVAIGTTPDDGTGDGLRSAFGKYNAHTHPTADVTGLSTLLVASGASGSNNMLTTNAKLWVGTWANRSGLTGDAGTIYFTTG